MYLHLKRSKYCYKSEKQATKKKSRILKTALKTLKERVQDKNRVTKQKEKELEEMVTTEKLSQYF